MTCRPKTATLQNSPTRWGDFNMTAAYRWLCVLAMLSGLVVPGAPGQGADLSAFRVPLSFPSPAFNPPTKSKVALGRNLFFDRRLSGANSISCASCHRPEYGWTDIQRFSVGETGELRPRRTPPLHDVAWNDRYARDGRIEILEAFILGPIAHPLEMNQSLELLPAELSSDPAYRHLYQAAFGTHKISLDGIVQGLASYVRTLRSGTSPFDRWVAGDQAALSDGAKRGFRLFRGKAGCADCYSG